jgi:hypothetical protein
VPAARSQLKPSPLNRVPRQLYLNRLLFIGLLCAGCAGEDPNRELVHDALVTELGAGARVHVAFMRDSSHLLVQLDTAVLSSLSDSAYARRSAVLAGIALSTYPAHTMLDSISVSTGETVAPNVAVRVRRNCTFAASALRQERSSGIPAPCHAREIGTRFN